MRLTLILPLIALSGICFAQDTSFSAGPQYLIPAGSGMLRSIATPSLSFGSAPQDAYIASTEIAPSVISSWLESTPSQTYRGDVYWGEHPASETVDRRIVTPSLTAEQTAYYTYATANLVSAPPPTNPAEVIEIPGNVGELANSSTNPFNPGVAATVNAESLSGAGYGLSLGEIAAYWKSHPRPARRLLTNQDVHRN